LTICSIFYFSCGSIDYFALLTFLFHNFSSCRWPHHHFGFWMVAITEWLTYPYWWVTSWYSLWKHSSLMNHL